jgi:GNAT superfamily N-acetyltransferase
MSGPLCMMARRLSRPRRAWNGASGRCECTAADRAGARWRWVSRAARQHRRPPDPRLSLLSTSPGLKGVGSWYVPWRCRLVNGRGGLARPGHARLCRLDGPGGTRQPERSADLNEVTLRRARPDEASILSDLALAAKGFWGYDHAFMEACRAELTFSPDDVARRHFVLADLGSVVVGFYSVDGEPPVGELGNMWVKPSEIGTGIGRIMWQHAMGAAAAAGFEYLEIGAEPNAVGFYRKMGAECIGQTASGSIPGRMLPLMLVKVSAAR